jgi:hypothetical protein
MTGSVDIVSISCDCRGTARPFTPCSRIGKSPTHQSGSLWYGLTLYETTRELATDAVDDILIGFQLFVVPAILVHPILILHIPRLHLTFIPVESDIWLGGRVISLTGVGREKGFDIWLSVCLVLSGVPLGRDIVARVRTAATEVRYGDATGAMQLNDFR